MVVSVVQVEEALIRAHLGERELLGKAIPEATVVLQQRVEVEALVGQARPRLHQLMPDQVVQEFIQLFLELA
jgi:hypothetical protein